MQVVISRYNEDLKWTLEYPFNLFKYIVYNKGIDQNFSKDNISLVIDILNVGRNDHTCLYHIVKNYDNLEDIIIFLPGSVDIKYKYNKAVYLLEQIKNNNRAYIFGKHENDIRGLFDNFYLDYWRCSHDNNKKINDESVLEKSSIRPYGKWYQHHFGDINVKYYSFHGIFSIDKKDILQHPIERYIKLLNEVNDHSNPEVGHYIERSWHAIFYPLNNTEVIEINDPSYLQLSKPSS